MEEAEVTPAPSSSSSWNNNNNTITAPRNRRHVVQQHNDVHNSHNQNDINTNNKIKTSLSSSDGEDEYNSKTKYRTHHNHNSKGNVICSYPVIITGLLALLYIIVRSNILSNIKITFDNNTEAKGSKNKNKMNERKMNNNDNNNGIVITINDWDQHIQNTLLYSEKYGIESITHYITAYIEPWYIWNDTISNTGSRGNLKDDKDIGIPPEFIIPLPLRTHTPNDLIKIVYNNTNDVVKTCYDMPNHFPIDRGYEIDPLTNQSIVWNVGDAPTSLNFPWEESKYCPVEADPFLPWIHDVFPDASTSTSSKSIHIIGQNKRRCRTGSKYTENVNRLIPQVTILQSVSVQRVNDEDVLRDAPDLWHPNKDYYNNKNKKKNKKKKNNSTSTLDQEQRKEQENQPEQNYSQTRYKLVPYDDADHDGMYTRFICQYYTTIYPMIEVDDDDNINEIKNKNQPKRVLIGETLSVFPFNYEYISYRKGKKQLLTQKGKDTTYFWTSTMHFECPIPISLQNVIGSGISIMSQTGISTIYLDIIPIRTSVRYDEIYMTEDMIGPKTEWAVKEFDAKKRWGNYNILPRIEASGRWTNIPICWIPKQPPDPPLSKSIKSESSSSSNSDTAKTHSSNHYFDPSTLITSKTPSSSTSLKTSTSIIDRLLDTNKQEQSRIMTTKKHYLSACLWASSAFRTRGQSRGSDKATNDRLIEWIEFHLMVGFDHIYLYDNSGAHTNDGNLQNVVDMYHPSQITRIDWPSSICNNNVPAADSTGERSTQYAAENSCRSRYASYTEWIAVFDTDEYMVPMGTYTNLKDFLYDAYTNNGTNIVSLRSSRGRLRMDKSNINTLNNNNRTSLFGYDKSNDTLYLEAYNCDSAGSPKPTWGDRARKQIYRSDYVLHHFVHYSTVTQGYLITYQNMSTTNDKWHRLYYESQSKERVSDEFNEAVLVHTKTLTNDFVSSWQKRCLYNYTKKWQGCWAAIPWPYNITLTSVLDKNSKITSPYDMNGYEYNCFINTNVENYWVPKLKEAMNERRTQLQLLQDQTEEETK